MRATMTGAHPRTLAMGMLVACSGCTQSAASLDAGRMDVAVADRVVTVPADASDEMSMDVYTPPLRVALDRYGGAMRLPIANATGYFAVAQAWGRAWFVTPDGHAFVSMGVNHISPQGDTELVTGNDAYGTWVSGHYANEGAWTDTASMRLAQWTFNTVGAWSRYDLFAGRIAQTPMLGFAGDGWQVGSGPDVFDPAWITEVMASAVTQIGTRASDRTIIGWFLDNELRWGPDWRSAADLFDVFVALPATAPGKIALVASAQRTFGDIASFNTAFASSLASWEALRAATTFPAAVGDSGAPTGAPAAIAFRHAWTGEVAEQYFNVTAGAVRAADPHHLVLGCRFVSWLAPSSVVAAAGRHVDVVSVNYYEISRVGQSIAHGLPAWVDHVNTDRWLEDFATVSGRPLMISEFGARAADSGLPNTDPPALFQMVWATQNDRADALERYGLALATEPYLVGIHWFEYFDEPPGGRFDGENSNWGLVNAMDAPYEPVVDRAPLVGPMLTYAMVQAP